MNTAAMELRSEGTEAMTKKPLSMIWGIDSKGMGYNFVVEAAPLKVRFEDTAWPEVWDGA